MDTIIRSRHGYREKRINVSDHVSSSLWKAVPKEKPKNEFWKIVAAVILVVFAAVLLLRTEVVDAVRQVQQPEAAQPAGE